MNGDALQVAARGVDQIGRSRKRFAGNASKALAIRRTLAEPLPDLVCQRVSEIRVIDNS